MLIKSIFKLSDPDPDRDSSGGVFHCNADQDNDHNVENGDSNAEAQQKVITHALH